MGNPQGFGTYSCIGVSLLMLSDEILLAYNVFVMFLWHSNQSIMSD